MKFFPYKKEWGGKSHGIEGGTRSLAILNGGAKSFYSLKGGRKMFYPVLRVGGGAKSFGPVIFPFCSPPPPPRK